MLKELGIVRSVLLVGLLALAVAISCKVEASWILPVACLLVIGGYHQTRKDRDFLRRLRLSPDAEGQGLLAPVHR